MITNQVKSKSRDPSTDPVTTDCRISTGGQVSIIALHDHYSSVSQIIVVITDAGLKRCETSSPHQST